MSNALLPQPGTVGDRIRQFEDSLKGFNGSVRIENVNGMLGHDVLTAARRGDFKTVTEAVDAVRSVLAFGSSMDREIYNLNAALGRNGKEQERVRILKMIRTRLA